MWWTVLDRKRKHHAWSNDSTLQDVIRFAFSVLKYPARSLDLQLRWRCGCLNIDKMDEDVDYNSNGTTMQPVAEEPLDPVADIKILKVNMNDLFLVLMGAIILFMQVWSCRSMLCRNWKETVHNFAQCMQKLKLNSDWICALLDYSIIPIKANYLSTQVELWNF